MKILSERKDIIWCPSQIYIIVEWGGHQYQIYARWRHSWHIFLSTSIENPYDGHTYQLDAREFTDDNDINELVNYMKSETEIKLTELFPLT